MSAALALPVTVNRKLRAAGVILLVSMTSF